MNFGLVEPAVLLLGGALALMLQAKNPKAVPWSTRLAEVGSVVMALLVSSGLRALYALPFAGGVNVPRVLLALLAVDFSFYWLHRLCHGALWRTHKNHHAATHFDAGLAFRDSGVHLVLFTGLFAVLQVVMGLSFEDTTLVSAAIISIQWWTHTRTWVSFGPLDRVLIGPRHHYVHHAPAEGRRLINLGTFLCLWDQLFGTYQHPPKQSPLGKPMPPRKDAITARSWVGV